jgi:hypothetical protein
MTTTTSILITLAVAIIGGLILAYVKKTKKKMYPEEFLKRLKMKVQQALLNQQKKYKL